MSCHVRRNEEKTTKLEKITDSLTQQIIAMLKMFQGFRNEIGNDLGRMNSRVAALEDVARAGNR